MAGGCGAEPRASQYGGATPGDVGTVRTAHGTGRCGPHAIQVNTTLLLTYWNVGRLIVEDEQNSARRAEYGKQVLKELSKRLTKDFGKGFSRSNLHWMRELYIKYPNCQTLSNKLTWSHYCELLTISDATKRSFYEHECVNAHWSFRELKRQIREFIV